MKVFIALLMVASGIGELFAQNSILPSGGLAAGTVYGPVSRQVVGVAGQNFTSAVRLQTTSQPALTYDAGFTLGAAAALAVNDVLAGEIWMRRLAPTGGTAFATFNFEKASANYDKSHAVTLASDSTNWSRFRFAFASVASYSTGAAHVAIHLGFPPQTIELGGLVITNYGKTRQLAEFPNDLTYPGRSLDAPWRVAAAQRIEQLRKADLTVSVTDLTGRPVTGAEVSVTMKRHAFGFGSAVDGARLLGLSGTVADRDRYRSVITNSFNKVVLENDLKWPVWESNRTRALNALDWFNALNIPVRGHNLIWPGTNQTYLLPADVPRLLTNAAALRQRINSHFGDILAQTRGKCAEWDVINEPYANHAVMDVLGVNEKVAWYKLANSLDTNAVLYLNEYGNLERAGLNDPQTDDFFNQLKFLQDSGAPLGGIGMQSHFGSYLPDPVKVYEMLNRFSGFGLPIQATEFDIDIKDEATQAEYTRDFMTMLFSHPSVNGILMWGFWAGQHWLPDAALWRTNWTVKPNGEMWQRLVFQDWWTDLKVVTASDGSAKVRAFKGDYVLTVKNGATNTSNRVSVTGDMAVSIQVSVDPPKLRALIQPDGLRLSWPLIHSGFRLESAAGLSVPGWQPVLQTPAASNDEWRVKIDAPLIDGRFYRLAR